MIVGILSDTHGRADAARIAVRMLVDRGATHLIHCGDVGDGAAGLAVLDAMAGHKAAFVFGNNDYDERELERYAGDLGIVCLGHRGVVDFDGKYGVVTHGHDPRAVRAAKADPTTTYLFVGHTHEKLDRRDGRVRTINPGALYRATTKTVALLDTVADTLEFVPVVVPA